MPVLDLTHFLSPSMPVYPGTEPPTIRPATTVEADGFAEKWIGMYSHTGTHIDAPAHMLPGAATLDQLGIDRFVGPAWVVDAPGPAIGLELLEAHEADLAGSEFVLFHTGWSAKWGVDAYYAGFPVLTAPAARWLCERGLKGVGFDAISADPVGSAGFENHLAFFRAGMIIIENLAGLKPLIGKPFRFSCLPLKLEQADGSPVRAVAMLP
jgi:kynurenine formamidase